MKMLFIYYFTISKNKERKISSFILDNNKCWFFVLCQVNVSNNELIIFLYSCSNYPYLDALNETETSRRRRHQHHQALPMMMMGIVIFLMFFVPMGFNFLGVIVGKSFLMAKLGLLLASVNGLKRVLEAFL
jgi:hypothetical protein